MMSIAVYLRVSTQLQAQAQTSEQQLERLRAHIQQTGGTLPAENVFRDDGYSGASLNRPGLDALRDQVKAGEAERVLITAPDRLARNYVHQMVLLEELQRAGCAVEFLDRPMSDDPHDQLLLQIRGAVAEYERTLIAERMRRGRQRKLQAGALLPWTHVPYGYRVNPDRPRDPAGVQRDEAEAAVIQEMFAWYLAEGASLAGLTRHLQALGLSSPRGLRRWNQATVRGILMNPAYTGQVYLGRTQLRAPRLRRSATHPIGRPAYGRTATPPETWIPVATIPAIISQTSYDQVQAKLAHNQQFARRNNTAHDYLLRALVSCGVCNLACTGRGRVQYRYYVCRGKAPPRQSCRDERCSARLIPAGQLDDLVWQDVCEVLTHPELIAHALERAHGGHWLPQELQARRETLRKGRVQLQSQLERLSEAYLHGIIPLAEYERRRRDLEQKDEALDAQARQLEAQVDRQAELAGLVASVEAFCGRVQAGLAQANFEQKRQLVELLIDRVVVTHDEVEIRYVIPTSQASEQVRFCHLRKDYFGVHPDGVFAQPGARGGLIGDERQHFRWVLLIAGRPGHRQVRVQLAVLGQPDLLVVTALAGLDPQGGDRAIPAVVQGHIGIAGDANRVLPADFQAQLRPIAIAETGVGQEDHPLHAPVQERRRAPQHRFQFFHLGQALAGQHQPDQRNGPPAVRQRQPEDLPTITKHHTCTHRQVRCHPIYDHDRRHRLPTLQGMLQDRAIQLPHVHPEVLQPAPNGRHARFGLCFTGNVNGNPTQGDRIGLHDPDHDPHPIGQMGNVGHAYQGTQRMDHSRVQFSAAAHGLGSFGSWTTKLCQVP
jgi:site-specific DNA recombinase